MRRFTLPLCSLLALLATSGPVRAQPAYPSPGRLQRITIEKKPLSANVLTIFQDSKGLLWFGTLEGLIRYDGYQTKTYRQAPGASNGLLNNAINAIDEDAQGALWIGTNNGLYAFDPLTERFTRFEPDSFFRNNVGSQIILSLRTDPAGNVWASTNTCGVARFDLKNRQTRHFFPDPDWPERYDNSFCSGLYLNSEKTAVWAAMQSAGSWKLCRTDPVTLAVTVFDIPGFSTVRGIHRVLEDRRGRIWLATDIGMWKFDPEKGICTDTRDEPFLPEILKKNRIFSLMEGKDGTLWVGTFSHGLFGCRLESGQITHYPFKSAAGDGSSSTSTVSSILEDQLGDIWVGLTGGGLYRLERNYNIFHLLEYPKVEPSDRTVEVVCEDLNGNLYFGSGFGFLYEWDRTTRQTRLLSDRLPGLGQIPGFIAMDVDRHNNLWLGLNSGGLLRIAPDRKNTQKYRQPSASADVNPRDYVASLAIDANDNIWEGTYEGLYKLDVSSHTYTSFLHDPSNPQGLVTDFVGALLFDSAGRLWVGTDGAVSLREPGSDAFVHLIRDADTSAGRMPLQVFNLYQDHTQAVWAGTNYGLYRIRSSADAPHTWPVDHFTEADGLPNANVLAMLEDRHYRLWITTQPGITCLTNPQAAPGVPLRFRNFGREFNYEEPHFYVDNACRSRDGKLFFCSPNGLLYIHEDSVFENSRPPQIAITTLEKYNTDFPEKPAESETGITHRSEVRLSYKNNIFTLEFAALDYRAPEQNQYAYRMTGFNDNWIQLGNRRRVTFTNLDPGTYFFTVIGSNSDGVWNEEGVTLKIVITPPWWRTVWAYLAYVLLFAGAVSAFIRARTGYLKRRAAELEEAVRLGTAQIVAQKEKIEQQAVELQELERIKWRFYTNITHELRTPLTLMLGPLSTLLKGKSPNAPDFHLLKIAQQNGRKLFRRVSEMLDFSKLESENIELAEKPVRIVSLTSRLVGNFESHAQFLGIDLTHRTDIAPERSVMLDTDKYETIVDNLLSNALKFTSRGGWVKVSLEEPEAGFLRLTVRDNGPGIHPQDLPHIFNRYYQTRHADVRAEGGTGIGLALCAELARLFGGDIRADSSPGAGSAFVVQWPVTDAPDPDTPADEQAWFAAPPTGATADATPAPARPEGVPRLLVVEDNPDLQAFLVHLLSDAYVVHTAPNGEEALEWLGANAAPDLILSDIMMPRMDGYQLLDQLKSDDRYRHIPVVLLTARADISDRLRALRAGVHDYLTKPFEEEELTTRIENLLRHGQERRSAREADNHQGAGAAMSEADAEWLAALEQWTRENLRSDLLNVPAMAQQANLSERQLLRRLRETTGMSPQQYIQELRLINARDLLERGACRTVAEAAYAAGFGHPKVFSRAYRERFGRLPSTYF